MGEVKFKLKFKVKFGVNHIFNINNLLKSKWVQEWQNIGLVLPLPMLHIRFLVGKVYLDALGFGELGIFFVRALVALQRGISYASIWKCMYEYSDTTLALIYAYH